MCPWKRSQSLSIQKRPPWVNILMFCFLSCLFFSLFGKLFSILFQGGIGGGGRENLRSPHGRGEEGRRGGASCGPLGLTFWPHSLTASGWSLVNLVEVLLAQGMQTQLPPLQSEAHLGFHLFCWFSGTRSHPPSGPQTWRDLPGASATGFPVLCFSERLQVGSAVVHSQLPSSSLSWAPENFPELLSVLLTPRETWCGGKGEGTLGPIWMGTHLAPDGT